MDPGSPPRRVPSRPGCRRPDPSAAWMSTVDPRRVLVFREVARAGSLAGAARALGWTQPAVSQQVRQLEREVGTALVVRQGRGVALTEAGRVLLRRSEEHTSELQSRQYLV